MLGEGFLRLLRYKEERKFASKQKERQTSPQCSEPPCSVSDPDSTEPQMVSTEGGSNQEVLGSSHDQGLRVDPQVPGLLIPGCLPVTSLHPVCIDDCSLLEQYPDLQVADSGRISHNLSRAALNPEDFYLQPPAPEVGPQTGAQQNQQDNSVLSIPDQGYLVMGNGVNISLDLPGSGLEPMSNSVLNGLLEKQLEEVYMQHLTDNLARCNSHLGNSLLHGLVPPPQQPGHPSKELYSLETSLEEDSAGESCDMYLSTQNVVHCSSTFSSPVLRISELENPRL